MCTPKTPDYVPPAPPPEAPKAPRAVDAAVTDARTRSQNQARAMSGRASTVLTNPSLGMANTGATGGKTLLGQ